MLKKAILVVSFGTSYEETRQMNIVRIEKKIAEVFTDYKVYNAYTSTVVRKILSKRGIYIDDVTSAMERMYKEGITEVVIQPTHLLYGYEYDKLVKQVEAVSTKFSNIVLSWTLLSNTQDLRKVLTVLAEEISLDSEQALVFMGHGTHHFANVTYPAMNYMAKVEGMDYIFIGAVEGYPELNTIIADLKNNGYKKVLLTPLMLVAGDHAINDMASDEKNSWKSLLSKEGFEVDCLIKGIGEYPGIVNIYLEHLNAAIS